MVIVKGLLAAALAGLGMFAVYTAGADPTDVAAAQAAPSPPVGLAGLLRPLEH